MKFSSINDVENYENLLVTLKQYIQLLKIAQGDVFKIKALEKAHRYIRYHFLALNSSQVQQLKSVAGIGKSTFSLVDEIIKTQRSKLLEEICKLYPIGLTTLFGINKLGAKKINLLWQHSKIDSLEALKDFALQNKLAFVKGFNEKSQKSIIDQISIKETYKGYLLSKALKLSKSKQKDMQEDAKEMGVQVEITEVGDLGKKNKIVSQIEWLVSGSDKNQTLNLLQQTGCKAINNNHYRFESSFIPIDIKWVDKKNYLFESIRLTSSPSFQAALIKGIEAKDEKEYFKVIQKPFLRPEMREELFFQDWKNKRIVDDDFVQQNDIKGTIHNHSTWSDGIDSLETMACFAKDKMALNYYACTDHSQSAIYANGLNPERVALQQQEIDLLNEKLFPFRILKGIEVDILSDGRLDFDASFLKCFDITVASVHTGFEKNKQENTQRIIKAIEQPGIHILGHPTGRLLLSRQGYEIDHEKIIDACAANHTAIELNCNPLRFDIDPCYIQTAIKKGVKISINPDAHRVADLYNMELGIFQARKGGLVKDACLNTLHTQDLINWLSKK